MEISELAGLVKCISKQSVEVAFWFLVAAYSKIQENKITKESTVWREMGIDKFENSYNFHMAHNDKIKKWLLRKDEIQGTAKKTWSKDEAKGILVRSLVKIWGGSSVYHSAKHKASKEIRGVLNLPTK